MVTLSRRNGLNLVRIPDISDLVRTISVATGLGPFTWTRVSSTVISDTGGKFTFYHIKFQVTLFQ